ncbi:MAG: hypothetical protein IK078_04125 [Lachnospiraceae bacterium]|nr:hypothetical protein [Lachnospiraceae bacterium]
MKSGQIRQRCNLILIIILFYFMFFPIGLGAGQGSGKAITLTDSVQTAKTAKRMIEDLDFGTLLICPYKKYKKYKKILEETVDHSACNYELYFEVDIYDLENVSFRLVPFYDDVSPEVTKKQIRKARTRAEKIAKQIRKSYDTKPERIRAAHDYLCRYVRYDEGSEDGGYNPVQTAYGALINGRAVCQGYSNAFQMLMEALGIPASVVLGDAHAWNAVWVDGHISYIDVTWDDCNSAYGSVDDTYFMRSKKFFQKSHDWGDGYSKVVYKRYRSLWVGR